MGQRSVRVVVGQGDPEREGYLRGVLEQDGFDVVGEASSTSPLARLLTDERPDVVVLDDGIGVSAVQVAAEIVPSAKIVVVWPAAVMPIAGAIRVDPSDVERALAPTVAIAAGIGGLGFERPEWIERVRKDPATLRELLAARGGVPTRPSVTELQRRGHRLHPAPGSPRRTSRPRPAEPERGGVVTPLPLATATASASATVPSSWNRRLGVIALGGAVAASGLMIALAFGNPRTLTTAGPSIQATPSPSATFGGQTGGGEPTGGGTQTGGDDVGTVGGAPAPPTDGSGLGGTDTLIRGEIAPTPPPDGGGSTGGSPDGTGGGDGSHQPHTNKHLPGDGDGDRDGDDGDGHEAPSAGTPGNSGEHNPHGGPPGWTYRDDHGAEHASNGIGHAYGHSSHARGASGSHANSHAHER